ncbi:hypothetical protein KIW84_053646, partial [Lathyrus oleraceus]
VNLILSLFKNFQKPPQSSFEINCIVFFFLGKIVMNGEECETMERVNEKLVYMWGYLPGALPQRTPLLTPVLVRAPAYGYNWKDVSGGGCGFAMAISEQGKLITWGSTDDLGQSYVTSGKHGEIPEPFPLPNEVSIVKAAAAWAHCVAVTDCGEVYTWGWKECIPSGKVLGEPLPGIPAPLWRWSKLSQGLLKGVGRAGNCYHKIYKV